MLFAVLVAGIDVGVDVDRDQGVAARSDGHGVVSLDHTAHGGLHFLAEEENEEDEDSAPHLGTDDLWLARLRVAESVCRGQSVEVAQKRYLLFCRLKVAC